MNEKVKAWCRIIVLFITMINAILAARGITPIPFDEGAFYEVASTVVAGAAAVWNWYKNNNLTVEAQTAQRYLISLKATKENAGGANVADPADPEVE